MWLSSDDSGGSSSDNEWPMELGLHNDDHEYGEMGKTKTKQTKTRR